MPVRLINLVSWPNSTIPYENDATAKSVSLAIDQFNREVGFDLFVPRADESHYAQFLVQMVHDSPMGCQSTGMQKILIAGPQKPWTTLHEMGHCAGLGHEHFHSAYPLQTARSAYIAKEKQRGIGEVFAIDLFQRKLTGRASYTDLGALDTDSIEMYNDMRELLGITGARATQLTHHDVQALRTIYQQPPHRFVLHVQGGSPDDSLALEYEVRTAGNPTTVVAGNAHGHGKTRILGIPPQNAEIRFKGYGATWTRVVLGRTCMLQGGRYTYTCN